MTNELVEKALTRSDALSNAIACRLGHGDHGREGFATEIAVLEELEAERYQHIVAGLATANANLTDRLKELEAPTRDPVASQEPPGASQSVVDEPERAQPRSGTGGAHEAAEFRSWWRRCSVGSVDWLNVIIGGTITLVVSLIFYVPAAAPSSPLRRPKRRQLKRRS
jgi:hypothetical protein